MNDDNFITDFLYICLKWIFTFASLAAFACMVVKEEYTYIFLPIVIIFMRVYEEFTKYHEDATQKYPYEVNRNGNAQGGRSFTSSYYDTTYQQNTYTESRHYGPPKPKDTYRELLPMVKKSNNVNIAFNGEFPKKKGLFDTVTDMFNKK